MKLENVISWTLRIGVTLSALLVVSGIVLYFAEGDTSVSVSSSFTVTKIFAGVAQADPLAIILLGVIVLIATPVIRVFELLLNYVWNRDRLYVLLSFLVLFFMLAGIILLPILKAG